MKILFLTIGQIGNLKTSNVHADLVNALALSGHEVTVVSTLERRFNQPSQVTFDGSVRFVRQSVLNVTQCSLIEKGLGTILFGTLFKRAIRKHLKNESFDLILYHTPPITLCGAVAYAKKLFKAKTYLALKDIFPQNAVDLGMLSKQGLKGLLYNVFRKSERRLYEISDRIGCMSEKNRSYLLEHNPYLPAEKAEIFYNAVLYSENDPPIAADKTVLDDYGIPADRPVFLYGGNLGAPQGLDFFAEAVKACKDDDCSFVVAGAGTGKAKLFESLSGMKNVFLFDYLPCAEYKALCAACDVGIVMLDKRFTIPNYPSRILSYLVGGKPVLACTDRATDIKELVESEACCGVWCASDDVSAFKAAVKKLIDCPDRASLGRNGQEYAKEHFDVMKNVVQLEKFVENT